MMLSSICLYFPIPRRYVFEGDTIKKNQCMYARKPEDIPYDGINKGSGQRYQKDLYVCRKDEAGRKLDRRAMVLCSKALGHNRVSVVAENYLRGI